MLARLGWQEIPWHGHWLGLQAKKSPCVDVGICPQSTNAVSTQGSKYPTSTIPTRYANLQHNMPICWSLQHVGTTEQRKQNVYPRVIGTFLYYARCVDSWMLPALRTLATQQATPTKNTMKKIKQFLDYPSTTSDAVVTYHGSDTVLARHSNASYLSKSNARSRARGHFFISSNVELPPNSGVVSTILQIIKAVMSLGAEAKVGALFINCHEAVPARHVLEFLGHPQPPTPMQTDNMTALGVLNQNVMKKMKLMDIKYHWLQCRINQKHFWHYWAARKLNLGNYFTKHHPVIHHQATRGTFLTDILRLIELRNRHKGYAVTTTSRSKGVLDRSGQPDMAGNYEKALAARKLLNVKNTHSDRHLYVRTTQLQAQIEKLWRRRLCSSLERIIEAKSDYLYQ